MLVRLLVSVTLAALATRGPAQAQTCDDGILKVGIDIGHTRAHPGATSATGKKEYDFNRRFALELMERAKSRPTLRLIMLNAAEAEVTLEDRPREAARHKAGVFLSIHHDAVNHKYIRKWIYREREQRYSDAFTGHSLFIWDTGSHVAESLVVATAIGQRLKAAGFTPTGHHAEPIPGENRPWVSKELGIYAAPFAVLRHATMPAVLFEVGIIVNRTEEKQLEDADYRGRIQTAILDALSPLCPAR